MRSSHAGCSDHDVMEGRQPFSSHALYTLCNSPSYSCASSKFSAKDNSQLWRGVLIPTVLALHSQGQRIKSLMNLEVMDIDPFGEQFMEASS